MSEAYITGITGGSGSGKTLFLNKLMSRFREEEICLISQDNYYIPRNEQPQDEEGVSNFDTLKSIDLDAFVSDIHLLRAGSKVVRKEYTFNNPDVVPEALVFTPAPLIIIEGIFILHHTPISEILDLKVFIDAKEHLMLKRRIIRDKVERGYDLDDVLYRYDKHVMPTFAKYIEPYKNDCDLIIPNNSHFENALDILTAFLKTKVSNKKLQAD